MIALRHTGLVLTGALLAMLTGCATTHGGLASSAAMLEHDSDVLASDARADSAEHGTADYSGPARYLADQAHDFRRTVENRNAGDHHVANAFDRLSRSYDELRSDVERTGGADASVDLRRVTQDYRDIEQEVRNNPAQDRYAEKGDQGDRS